MPSGVNLDDGGSRTGPQGDRTELRADSCYSLHSVTDRHALLPVVLVLTGDKADCVRSHTPALYSTRFESYRALTSSDLQVVVERFQLAGPGAEDTVARQQVWDRTKALLRRSGMRVTDVSSPSEQRHSLLKS